MKMLKTIEKIYKAYKNDKETILGIKHGFPVKLENGPRGIICGRNENYPTYYFNEHSFAMNLKDKSAKSCGPGFHFYPLGVQNYYEYQFSKDETCGIMVLTNCFDIINMSDKKVRTKAVRVISDAMDYSNMVYTLKNLRPNIEMSFDKMRSQRGFNWTGWEYVRL